MVDLRAVHWKVLWGIKMVLLCKNAFIFKSVELKSVKLTFSIPVSYVGLAIFSMAKSVICRAFWREDAACFCGYTVQITRDVNNVHNHLR